MPHIVSHVLQELDSQDPVHKQFWDALTVTAMPHIVSHVFQELDSQDPVHKQFWDAMMVIAEVELQEALKQDELDWARLRGEPIPAKYTIKEAGLHESVDSDVQMMLAGRCCCDVVTKACLP